MLQTWDFIDPRLARKLAELQHEIKVLSEKRASIEANHRITNQAKQKLLAFNDQCMRDLLSILAKQQSTLADYLDRQVEVLTKKQITRLGLSQRGTIFEGPCSFDKVNRSQEMTKLTLDDDRSNLSCNLNRTKHYIQLNSCESHRKFDALETTGRLTRKAVRNREGDIELALTDRNCSSSHTDHYGQQQVKKVKNRARARISRTVRNRMRRKLATKQFQLEIHKLKNSEIAQKLEHMEKEERQSREIIELLRKKISLLELHQHKALEADQQRAKFSNCSQLEEIRSAFFQLSEIRNENEKLMLQRKEMLRTRAK